MRYDSKKPEYLNHKVYLNGNTQPDAIEADDIEGWVLIEKTIPVWSGACVTRKKHYGRIHIVKFVGYDEEETIDEKEEFEPTYD